MLLTLAGTLFCGVLPRESRSELSVFVVLYALTSNRYYYYCCCGCYRNCRHPRHYRYYGCSFCCSTNAVKAVNMITFIIVSQTITAYLNDLILDPVRPLRSSDAPLLNVPRTRTEFARRSFSVAAPHTWNSLPSDVRSCRTVDTFKRHLKTHLFRQS